MTNATWAGDVAEPEGPVGGPDGSLYIVEVGAVRPCVSRIGPDGKGRRSIVQTVRRPNGLAIDGSERLWIAEAFEGAIICTTSDGRELKRITGDGARFLWPNDLVFAPNGLLYLTDSGILEGSFIDGVAIRPNYPDLEYDGKVFEIDPASDRVLRQLDRGLKVPNGIALGPDGTLYANETLTGEVYRYDLSKDRPERQSFGNVSRRDLSPAFRGPDCHEVRNRRQALLHRIRARRRNRARSGRLRFGTHRDAWQVTDEYRLRAGRRICGHHRSCGVGGRAHACILSGRSASLSGLSDLSADRIHCG
jgi:gluconolactonase